MSPLGQAGMGSIWQLKQRTNLGNGLGLRTHGTLAGRGTLLYQGQLWSPFSSVLVSITKLGDSGMPGFLLSTKPQILWVLPRHTPSSTPPHCCSGTSYPGLCYPGAVARCSVAPRELPHPFLHIRARADATACNQPPHSSAQAPPHQKRVPSSSTLAPGSPQDFVFLYCLCSLSDYSKSLL